MAWIVHLTGDLFLPSPKNGGHRKWLLRGQRKMEHRASTQLTDDADLASVQFDDRFRNRKSHTRAGHQHALISAAIKLLENHFLFHLVDARTLIRYTRDHFRSLRLDSDVNRSLRR